MEFRIVLATLVAMAVINALAYKASGFQAAFEEKQKLLHEYWRSSAPPAADKSGH